MNAAVLKARLLVRMSRKKRFTGRIEPGAHFWTFLEKLGGYRDHRHGEAVAMGMVIAAYLPEELGLMQPQETLRIRCLCRV